MPKHTKFKNISGNFIETGSFKGDGIQLAINSGFTHITSIELSKHYLDICRDRFAGHEAVTLIHGDSYYELASLLKGNDLSYTYWLDGHDSGGLTAHGVLGFPIVQELEAILSRGVSGEVVYIDDMRILRDYSPHVNIDKFMSLVKRYKVDYEVRFERSSRDSKDIMVLEY